MEEPRGLRGAFVSLRYRDYRLLFVSHVVTQLGAEFLQVSNAWQVWALTGSAFHLGLTGVVRGIPVILFSLVGGVIADRADRRTIIIVTQLATGALALLLALLTLADLIQVWHIYTVVFLNHTIMTASNPARRAVLATVVPREHLMNAMVLNSLVGQADRIGAPALGGVLIALVGTPLTYALNGLTHVINAATLIFVAADLRPRAARQGLEQKGRPKHADTSGMLALNSSGMGRVTLVVEEGVRDIGEGLSFVRQHSIIWVILVMDAAIMLAGNHQVLLPVLADQYGVGPLGFGLLGSAHGVGSVAAITVLLGLGNMRYKGWLIGGGCLAYAVFLAMLGLAPWFWLALAAVAGLGLANSLQAQTRNVLIQLLTPDALRGRVTSFQSILQQGSPSLGQGLLGGAASLIGAGPALVAGGVICGLVNLGIVLRRKDLRAEDLGELRTVTNDALRVKRVG